MLNKLLTTALILFALISKAQVDDNSEINLSLKHIGGTKAIELQFGSAQQGVYYQISIHSYLSDKNILSAAYNFETGKIGLTNYTYNDIKFYYNRTLYNIKEKLFFNVMGGGTFGIINANNKEFQMKDNTVYFGIFAGGNLEYYPIRRLNWLSLIASFEQQYNFNDFFGKAHWLGGGGVRIKL